MPNIKTLLALSLLIFLTACGSKLPWASDERVQKATYFHGGTPSITLLTVINNKSGSGGHTALVVNASERLIYDPAGSFYNIAAPERADILHGITPDMLNLYLNYHARSDFHVVMQTKNLSAKDAEIVLRTAKNHGASASGFCSVNSSQIIASIPGLGNFPTSFYPVKTMKAFARLSGVTTRRIYQDDVGKN